MSIDNISKGRRLAKMTIAWLMVLFMAFTLLPTGAYAATNTPDRVGIKKIQSVNHNTVEITWGKVKSAEKYQVYKATKKNGKYKKVKTTKKRSCEITHLKTGKKYYFKVRAVSRVGKKGDFGKAKSGKAQLNQVSKVSAVTEGNETIFTWKEVKGARGYQVYKYDRDSEEYVKVATTRYTRYVDTGAKPNTNHIYKIRAYKKVSLKVTTKSGEKKMVMKTRYGKFRKVSIYFGDGATVMMTGPEFRQIIPAGIERIEFTDEKAPAGTRVSDLSADTDGSVVGWVTLDGKTVKVSTQTPGVYVKANPNMSGMFKNLPVKELDFTYLNNTNVRNMTGVFDGTTKLEKIIIGDRFSLKGNGNCDSGLPGRRVLYANDLDGTAYMEDDVPNRPRTYYLIRPTTATFESSLKDDLKIKKTEETYLTLPPGKIVEWLPEIETSTTKPGYRIAWVAKDGSEIAVGDLMPKKGNKYTAAWVPIKYTIEYDLDGSTAEGNPFYYTIESENITLKSPSKSGYTFMGWHGSNGATPSRIVTIPKGSMGDKFFVANFLENYTPPSSGGGGSSGGDSTGGGYVPPTYLTGYVVKYDANGGDGTMQESNFECGEEVKLRENTFTYAGYKFICWNTSKTGNGTAYSDEARVKDLVEDGKEITLYAQWEKL